jgi:branched-chain amino acid transport system ATP-binding protein
VLHVSDLDAFHGSAQALFGLSLEAEEGEVVALLGRNGSGKTTALEAIMGLVPTAAGKVIFQQRSIRGRAAETVARRGIAYVPADRRIFAELSVRENLQIARQKRRRGVPVWTVKTIFQLFPDLARQRARRGGALGGSAQKILSLARALMGNPRLILIDEPSEGADSATAEEMADTINFLKEEGLTIVIAEQNLHFAGVVGDRAYVIDNGRMALYGEMDELLANEKKWERYLAR